MTTRLAEVTATYRGYWRRGIAEARHRIVGSVEIDVHIDHDWVTEIAFEEQRAHRKGAMLDRALRHRAKPKQD